MSSSFKATLLAFAVLAASVPLSEAKAYDWRYPSTQVEDQSFADKLSDMSKWNATVGLGMGFSPRYEGSDRLEFGVLPVFDFSFDNRLLFMNMGGIGVTPLRGTDYHVGASLGYDTGRFESDDRKNLRGLNKVEASLLGKLFADYTFGPVTGAIETKSAMLWGDYGDTISARLGAKHSLSQSFSLNGDTHTTWADREHMRSFFGVTPSRAAASGKPYFDPDPGFKSFGFTLGARYDITQSWALKSSIKTDWLLGDADKSPVSVESFQPSGDLMVTYSF